MIRTHHFISPAALKHLRALAKKSGLSVSEHIRRAIDEYLQRVK